MTRQRYKNNGMESAPEMDMPAEKIYEQSVLKQKQRDQCYWMTVTASIKENTWFGVILGSHSQKRIPEDQHSMPTPRMHCSPWRSWSSTSSTEVVSGSSPVASKQTVLSEIQQPSEHREWAKHTAQEALWLAKHTALATKPCAIQGPGSPRSIQ